MITETFDNKTNAIITPQRVADAPKVDACIQTFSWKIEEFVLANFDCKKIASIWSATGETPVYCIEYKGKRFAFFKTYVGSPASVANLEDALQLLDTDKFIVFGGAGCLTHGEKNKAEVDKYGREALEKTIGDAISILK